MMSEAAAPEPETGPETQPMPEKVPESVPESVSELVPEIVAEPASEAAEPIETEGTLHVGGASHLEDASAPDSEPEPASEPDPAAGELLLRIAEAMVFSSATPVTARALAQILPGEADADLVLSQLRTRYAGRGVELVDVAGGVQFRSAPDLAERLRKVIVMPRRLPRVAMETLAIIAYHQPVTRPEIEEIRGTSLAQQTLDSLLEAGLVAPKGRKETPGRPTLWGTTEGFLMQFGLKDLRELPRREDLLLDLPLAASRAAAPKEGEPAAEPVAAQAGPEQPGPEQPGADQPGADQAGAEASAQPETGEPAPSGAPEARG